MALSFTAALAFAMHGAPGTGQPKSNTADLESRRVQFDLWMANSEKQAIEGRKNWSDLYKGVYAHLYFLPEQLGNELYLRASIALLEAWVAMESGAIDKRQFVAFQRPLMEGLVDFTQKRGFRNYEKSRETFEKLLAPAEAQADAWHGGKRIHCTASALLRVYRAECE
jgi:hypothetical protein